MKTIWSTVTQLLQISLLLQCIIWSGDGARLRLSHGTYGRVELLYSGSWGTICDDNWRINEGNVVCRELGFIRAEAVKTRAEYGQGSGYIHYFVCTGTETSLGRCSTRRYRINFCNHGEDVGVICLKSGLGTAIRLVEGHEPNRGRVEVFWQSQWGTVTDDGWDINDANVACKQLGYTRASSATHYAHFEEGFGPITMDNVACSGSEVRLQDCTFRGWHAHDSDSHSEDAGVVCLGQATYPVRLVGGSSLNQGRVEIQYSGLWGTVCQDGWDMDDATVVCRQLGYDQATSIRTNAAYGRGVGHIWMAEVDCSGDEQRLQDCKFEGWAIGECDHSSDVGIICSGTASVPIRLTGSSYGRVEVLNNRLWGTVCDSSWDIRDAHTVCRQLAFSLATNYYHNSAYGQGSGHIWMNSVTCSGNETNIGQCGFSGWDNNVCSHKHDSGARCAHSVAPLSLRLVGGPSHNQGRLEVFYGGVWGTVCDDLFYTRSATVACKQLGYTRGTYRRNRRGGFGPGTGPVWMDNVRCRGTESQLTTCQYPGWGVSNCGHDEDVGVVCSGKDPIAIRLVGSSSIPNQGRVEIYYGKQWGSVCDTGWTLNNAHVVCRQLGYARATGFRSNAAFGQGSGHIWMNNIRCSGNEVRLQDCQFSGWGNVGMCLHTDDVGVICEGKALTPVRLVGGSNYGRVEVFYSGLWGTVCDNGWGIDDAHVVCRQLGFTQASSYRHSAYYGQGTGHIWLTNVACNSYADHLDNCSHSGWDRGTTSCSHREDAGVVCSGAGAAITVRLGGGNSLGEGRVEVFYAGVWGTVCNAGWDTRDANVVCRQMGFSRGTAVTTAQFGQGMGPTWMNNVNCNGSERQLHSCSFSGWGASQCDHSRDAGVVCSGTASKSVRLVGGVTPNQGRIEVKYGLTWGTVCDDGWTREDSDVVCKQLGYSRSAVTKPRASYGQGSGHIWMSNVDCIGDESNIHDCPFDGWGDVSCRHTEDVGVVCEGYSKENPLVLRLAGNSNKNQGRVQVYFGNTWGSVCDSNWDIYDSHVVCRQLGYNKASSYRTGSAYGTDGSTVWMDNVQCTASKRRLQDCNFSGWGNKASHCSSSRKAGVICSGSMTQTFDVRITGGTANNTGRVEIQHQGVWGTICDDSWDIVDAQVVCNQLGFANATAALQGGNVVDGSGHIWMDNISCTGTETRLQDCPSQPFGIHNCGHNDDAGVACE